MTPRWRSLLAASLASASLLALSSPSAASAQTSPEERAFRVAQAAWGYPGHCTQGVTVGYRLMPRGIVGYAGEFCAIYLNSRYSYRYRALCTVIVHELGHVHGYGHISNRRDIMYFAYNGDAYWWACLTRRERQALRGSVDYALNRSSYPYQGRPGVDAARAARADRGSTEGRTAAPPSDAQGTQRFGRTPSR